MQEPIYPMVAEIVATFDEDTRMEFEERSGIIEFSGGVPRAAAEALAVIDIWKRHPELLRKQSR